MQMQADVDQKMLDDLLKSKLENKTLKAKIKREVEARNHWQDSAKKKEEDIIDLKK